MTTLFYGSLYDVLRKVPNVTDKEARMVAEDVAAIQNGTWDKLKARRADEEARATAAKVDELRAEVAALRAEVRELQNALRSSR